MSTETPLPLPLLRLLTRLVHEPTIPLHGSYQVQCARQLEARGLLTLRDNGYIRGERDAFGESERWDVTVTEAGEKVASSLDALEVRIEYVVAVAKAGTKEVELMLRHLDDLEKRYQEAKTLPVEQQRPLIERLTASVTTVKARLLQMEDERLLT